MSIPPIPEIPDWDENELKALQPIPQQPGVANQSRCQRGKA